MDDPPKAKKKWELTREAFDKLLAFLDPDRERAAKRYEVIRQKLITFFGHRGCPIAEGLTDETVNIVARKLDEGAIIYVRPESYFYGVARNVLKGYWGSPPTEPLPDPQNLPVAPQNDDEKIKKERRLECQKQCVQGLRRDLRELVIQYCREEAGVGMKESRRLLAEQLGVNPNALRIQVCRIRDRLDTCVLDCLGSSPDA